LSILASVNDRAHGRVPLIGTEVDVKLKAKVVKVLGRTRHAQGHMEGDRVVDDGVLPAPAWVQIEPDGDAYLLVYLDANGDSITDTWHQTLDDAKGQAEFEFGITEPDWKTVPE
jgi:hypothetical protein